MRRWELAAVPAAIAAAAVGVLLIDPFEDRGIGCPLHELTGWWCPGCGATRATWLLLHGDLGGVVRHNLLFLPALAYLVARYLHLLLPARTAWVPNFVQSPSAIPTAALRGLLLVVVVFTVARNLPAFAWLAPPDLPGANP